PLTYVRFTAASTASCSWDRPRSTRHLRRFQASRRRASMARRHHYAAYKTTFYRRHISFRGRKPANMMHIAYTLKLTMNDAGRRGDPDIGAVTPTTPLRLAIAAKLAFPDGSMKLSGLRREIARGRLAYELIAGKHYTTLADIEDMRRLCRIEVRAPGSAS